MEAPDPALPQPPRAAHAERAERLKAIGLMCAAVVLFSVLDASAKFLVGPLGIPVLQVVWARFFCHMLLTAAVLGPLAVPRLVRSAKPWHQGLRSLFVLGATAFNFGAVKYLQLDQTVTIFFLTPLIVAALAGPLLGEWVGWRRLLAILTGFLGVILVTRPGFGGIHWAVLFSFGATLSYSLYNVTTRYVAAHDSHTISQFYTPLAGVVLTFPFALSVWVWPADIWSWLLIASLGITGGVGHWLLILAHRHAPAPVVAPFVYVGLISMSILGYAIFGDIPTWWTLAGGAVVIGSGLYLLYRERQRA
jgi:drug/metabolite transporter (DMT)-like permease